MTSDLDNNPELESSQRLATGWRAGLFQGPPTIDGIKGTGLGCLTVFGLLTCLAAYNLFTRKMSLTEYAMLGGLVVVGIFLSLFSYGMAFSKEVRANRVWLDGIWSDGESAHAGSFRIVLDQAATAADLGRAAMGVRAGRLEPVSLKEARATTGFMVVPLKDCKIELLVMSSKFSSKNYQIAKLRVASGDRYLLDQHLKIGGPLVLLSGDRLRVLQDAAGERNEHLVSNLNAIAEAFAPARGMIPGLFRLLISPRSGLDSLSMPFGGLVGSIVEQVRAAGLPDAMAAGTFVDEQTSRAIVQLIDSGWEVVVEVPGAFELGLAGSDW